MFFCFQTLHNLIDKQVHAMWIIQWLCRLYNLLHMALSLGDILKTMQHELQLAARHMRRFYQKSRAVVNQTWLTEILHTLWCSRLSHTDTLLCSALDRSKPSPKPNIDHYFSSNWQLAWQWLSWQSPVACYMCERTTLSISLLFSRAALSSLYDKMASVCSLSVVSPNVTQNKVTRVLFYEWFMIQ